MLKTIKTIIEIKMPFKLAIKVLAIGLIENLVNLPKNLILGTITLIYSIFEILNKGLEWLFDKVDIIPELVIHCETREKALDFVKNYKKSIDKVIKV